MPEFQFAAQERGGGAATALQKLNASQLKAAHRAVFYILRVLHRFLHRNGGPNDRRRMVAWE
eukprot:3064580-Karenia_brevis.AAC.1